MPLNFLGQYLIQKGVVTREQLFDAIGFQKDINQLLGDMAVLEEMIDPEEVMAILEKQKLEDKPFGQIAVETGALTRRQLDSLLMAQAAGYVFLGEALMAKGYVKAADFLEAINEFGKLRLAVKNHTKDLLYCSDDDDFLMVVVDSARKAFERFVRVPVKIGRIREDGKTVESGFRLHALVELLDGMTIRYMLLLPGEFLKSLAGPEAGESELAQSEFWRETAEIIRRYVSHNLAKRGFMVRRAQSEFSGRVEPGPDLGGLMPLEMHSPHGVFLIGFLVEDRSASSARLADWSDPEEF